MRKEVVDKSRDTWNIPLYSVIYLGSTWEISRIVSGLPGSKPDCLLNIVAAPDIPLLRIGFGTLTRMEPRLAEMKKHETTPEEVAQLSAQHTRTVKLIEQLQEQAEKLGEEADTIRDVLPKLKRYHELFPKAGWEYTLVKTSQSKHFTGYRKKWRYNKEALEFLSIILTPLERKMVHIHPDHLTVFKLHQTPRGVLPYRGHLVKRADTCR